MFITLITALECKIMQCQLYTSLGCFIIGVIFETNAVVVIWWSCQCWL